VPEGPLDIVRPVIPAAMLNDVTVATSTYHAAEIPQP
jgi:hypothetical protein